MNRSERALVISLAFSLGTASLAPCQQSQEADKNEEGYYETAVAQASRWGDTGFFDVFSAYTLLKGKVSVAGFRDNIDRSPFSLDISNFAGTVAVGATDKLEIFGRIDVQRRIRAETIGDALIAVFPPPHYNDEPRVSKRWSSGFGDVWLGAKYNIMSEYDEAAAGLGVRGFVKLASADDDEGLGTGKASGGAHIVLSKNLGEVVESSFYGGFQLNGSPPDGKIFDIGNAFQWGAGVSLPRGSAIRGTAEITGQSFTGTDFDQTDPVDVLLGLTFNSQNGFFVTAGWRTNVNLGIDGETASGFNVSIGYHPGIRGNYIAPPPPPDNRPPTVQVTANPPEVEEGADSTVTADGNDPDGDPLTYSWRAPDGRITGSGPRVTHPCPSKGGQGHRVRGRALPLRPSRSDRRGQEDTRSGSGTTAGELEPQHRDRRALLQYRNRGVQPLARSPKS
jgi:hypothetical protein